MKQPFRYHLYHGETLLWEGKPIPGFMLRPSDGSMIPIGTVFVAFFGFVCYASIMNQATLGLILMEGIVLGIGIYLMVGRLIHDASIRAFLYYGITDKRILILSGIFQQQFRAYELDQQPNPRLEMHRNGTGSILLNQLKPEPLKIGQFDLWVNEWTPSAEFSRLEFLVDAPEAFDIIRRLKNGESAQDIRDRLT